MLNPRAHLPVSERDYLAGLVRAAERLPDEQISRKE